MDNPGLRRHTEAEPFLRVSNRRLAGPVSNPIMPAPMTSTIDGYETGDLGSMYGTQREDVETPPPLAGGATQLPVPMTNGEMGQDRTPNFEHKHIVGRTQAGAPSTQVPGTAPQHATQQSNPTSTGKPVEEQPAYRLQDHMLEDQQRELERGTRARQIAVQKQDGTAENPAYQRAQQKVQEKALTRAAHPLHQAASPPDFPDGLRVAHHDPDQDIHDVMDIQGNHGNWDYSEYMHGMFNGMELVRSIHDGDDPEFREAPEHWGYEKAEKTASDPRLTWDQIGEMHPTIYGDPEVHGDAAEGADGEGIGWAAAHLAFERPGHEEPDEGSWDLDFHKQMVPVDQIDYARAGMDDPRVASARRWYQEAPDEVVPPVLVHRHGVYQVADGHHRSEAAGYWGLPTIPAYVAQSPHEDEPFSDGARGPYHGATVSKTAAAPQPYRLGLEVKDYDGREGNNDHITRNEQGMVPIDWVRNLPGARGERPGEHRNYEGPEWEQFKAHVAAGTPGYSSPIFITVDHGGQPMINEGNHRRDAYAELGAPHVPVEIRYFGHAQRQGTVGERAMRHTASGSEDGDEVARMDQDPKGYLEGLVGGLPEAGSPVRYTQPTADDRYTLGEMGFGRHADGDESYWLRRDPDKDYVIAPGIDGYWETSAGPHGHWQEGSNDLIMPTGHTSFEEALEHMQVPPRAEPRRPGRTAPFAPGDGSGISSLSALDKQSETDDEFWARQPDVTSDMGVSPDAHQEAFMDTGDVEHDLEDAIPRNTALREHAHVLRNGFRWDGDERYPKYEQEHWRNIIDADGRPAGDKEGQVIERNTHVLRPVLEEGVTPLAHPWMHTYYPAGQGDDRGLVGGHNTAEQAVRAAHQLSLWGARHPDSQELLKGYQYVGDEGPYDPTEMLPHENAQRMGHV